MSHVVRLSITRLDLAAPWRPGDVLLDVQEASEVAADRARSWAQVRGLDRLVSTVDRLGVDGPAPESGYAYLVTKPDSLLVIATWPWCPRGMFDDRRFLPLMP